MNINGLLNISNDDICFHEGMLYLASRDMDFVHFLAKKFNGIVYHRFGYGECVWHGKQAKKIWVILNKL
jgi:hypothetical protein